MWKNELENFHNLLKQDLDKAAIETLEGFVKDVKKDVLNTKKIGGTKLRRDVKSKQESMGSIFSASVYMEGEVADVLESGSPPHTIQSEEVLVFEDKGHKVFTKEVEHPGVKATHFFSEICEENANKININFNNNTKK
jgi:hypothetical protein